MRPKLQLNIRPRPEDLEQLRELASLLNTTTVDAIRLAVAEQLKRVRAKQRKAGQVAA